MNKKTILITCIGGTLAMDNVIALKKDSQLDLTIIGVDSATPNFSLSYLDHFYKVQNGKELGYIEEIIEICDKHDVKLIIPGSDNEAHSLAKDQNLLKEKGISISCCSLEIYKLISNKASTYSILSKHNLNVPEYKIINPTDNLNEIFETIKQQNQSYVLKKRETRGGRGTYFLESDSDPIPKVLHNGQREITLSKKEITFPFFVELIGDGCIIMEVLSPIAYDVDVFTQNGKVKNCLIRERVNPCGIPFKGSIVRDDKKIQSYVESVCELLQADGLLDFDFMRDKNNEIQLLEINPRMSGSIASTYAFDYPILSNVIATLLGENYSMQPNIVFDEEVYLGVKRN